MLSLTLLKIDYLIHPLSKQNVHLFIVINILHCVHRKKTSSILIIVKRINQIAITAQAFSEVSEFMRCLIDVCRVFQLSHGGSKQSACTHRQHNMEARTRSDRCRAIMTFSASEIMSAADFCSFASVLCESHFNSTLEWLPHSILQSLVLGLCSLH